MVQCFLFWPYKSTMEQIGRVFDDNCRIIFVSSPQKDMLCVLIRMAN